MAELWTRVEIHYLPEFLNYWGRFGEPRHWQDRDRRRAFAYFAPGQVFGYVRWEANEYGTQLWRMFVVRAGNDVFPLDRIPGVTPGGEILLDLRGTDRVKKVLAVIDGLEERDLEPSEISPEYWIYVQNRVLTRLPIRPYDLDQHRAHLLRKTVCA